MGTRTRLEWLLFERRIKQADLSADTGVSRQTLSNALRGRPVSLETWIRLANALNVPLAEIAPPEQAALVAAVA